MGSREGTIWIPHPASAPVAALFEAIPQTRETGIDHYHTARLLGLTADPPPTEGRKYVMVAFDDRPGALEGHYGEELEYHPPPGVG
jgi:hypothetical protein